MDETLAETRHNLRKVGEFDLADALGLKSTTAEEMARAVEYSRYLVAINSSRSASARAWSLMLRSLVEPTTITKLGTWMVSIMTGCCKRPVPMNDESCPVLGSSAELPRTGQSGLFSSVLRSAHVVMYPT